MQELLPLMMIGFLETLSVIVTRNWIPIGFQALMWEATVDMEVLVLMDYLLENQSRTLMIAHMYFWNNLGNMQWDLEQKRIAHLRSGLRADANWHAKSWNLMPRHDFVGPTPGAKHDYGGLLLSPLECCLTLWNDKIQQRIVRESNNYAL
jgi:hypothetical protein